MLLQRFFLAAVATFVFVASAAVSCVCASTFALENDAASTFSASSSADASEVDFYLYFQPTRPDAFYFRWKEAVEKIRAKVGNDKINAIAAAIRSDASTLALRRELEGATLENVLVSSASSLGYDDMSSGDIFGVPFTWELLRKTENQRLQRLTDVVFDGVDLTGVSFCDWRLERVRFNESVVGLETCDFSGATLNDVVFCAPITFEQFASTRSFQNNALHDVALRFGDPISGALPPEKPFALSGWDFSGKDLSRVSFGRFVSGADADFTGADLGASFDKISPLLRNPAPASRPAELPLDMTEAQFASTASCRSGLLCGVSFPNDVSGWDFSDCLLVGSRFDSVSFADADFTDADVRGAAFWPNPKGTNARFLTAKQFYSTRCYKTGDLRGITFGSACAIAGWDFSKKNLSGCRFYCPLDGVDFTDAIITDVEFGYGVELTREQLESTWDFKSGAWNARQKYKTKTAGVDRDRKTRPAKGTEPTPKTE
ncbi:MAG: pentapeptide repeat-containing protein [Thermoguttaceae bacterium]|nr:pentapeptide repeat-containing protein [Thermoguttaceae bacterium]